MSLVRRRCVIWIGDYDPADVAQQFAGFQGELKQFAKTWNVTVRTSSFAMQDDNNAVAVWVAETKGPNWKVETEFRLFNWSDLIRSDFEKWTWSRVWRAAVAIGNSIRSGALIRYFRASWRFGLFFSYPLLIALAGLGLGIWLHSLAFQFGAPLPLAGGVAIGLVASFAFMRWGDPSALRIVRLWTFLHDLVFLKREGFGERLDRFAYDLEEQLRYQTVDEIVFVAHGMGAALQPVIVDRAFWRFREFGRKGETISLVSAGSMLLSVGLHPEADWLIGPVLRVSRDRMVFWADYQMVGDPVSFPGRNPVSRLIDSDDKPVVREIRFDDMPGQATKWFSPARAAFAKHQRFLRANVKRCPYDFLMICCGPLSLPRRARDTERTLSALEADGRLNSAEFVVRSPH